MPKEHYNIVSTDEFKNTEGEEWRTVEYIAPNIQVSSFGRLRELVSSDQVKLLHTYNNREYAVFSYKSKPYLVHRLVADAFLPRNSHQSIVVHKNGINDDNRVENLEWASRAGNFKNTDRYVLGKKIYCQTTDQIFGTLFSAAILSGIGSSELIAKAIAEGKSICGLKFSYIEKDHPILADHKVLYIDSQTAFDISTSNSSYEEFFNQVIKYATTSAAQL